MTKDKASVYVDAQSLYELLYDIQFRVPKRERVCIMPRIFDHCEGIIKYFDLAYHTSDKLKYIELMMGEFATLKNRSEFNTIKRLTAMINPDWLKYLEMDWDRCCLITKEGYKHKDNLKYLIYDKIRAY